MNLFDLSAVLLLAFVALGAIDGLYLHLWRFRLHARPESRREHLLHTARAVLMVPLLVLVFAGDTSGPLLWAGIAVIALDVVATAADVFIEPDSRAFQGGLPRGELVLHIVLTVLHVAAIALVLWARPSEAWLGTTSAHVADAAFARFTAYYLVLPGAALAAALHVALYLWPWGAPEPSRA